MPEQGGNLSVRLAGDDQLENVRLGGEFLHQRVRRIEGQRLDAREMLQDGKDIFVGGADGQFKAGAAKLQLRAALEKMPGEAGAERDGALEARIANFRRGRNFASRRKMRIEHEQNAKIFFVREFADHQIAEARGRFPVDVARAVVRKIFAERVQILAAAFGHAFESAFDAGKNFREVRDRFDVWIDENFFFQFESAGFLQEAEGKTRDDAKRILAIDAALRKRDGHALAKRFLPWQIGKINFCLKHCGGGVRFFRNDGFDRERKGRNGQFFVFQFDGGAFGIAGKNVLRHFEMKLDAGKADGGENAGHQDDGNEARENEEEEIVAGVERGESDEEGAEDVNPAGARDFVLHPVADPAERRAFGESGN